MNIMKKSIKHLLFANIISIMFCCFSALAVGANLQSVRPCVALSEIVQGAQEDGQAVSLDRIPKKLLVASSVDYFVQSRLGSFLQVWAQHSFRQAHSTFKCYSGNSDETLSFVVSAPTLIDQTVEHKTGNSFWQFHLSLDKNKLGIWNQKTRLFPNSKFWPEQLNKIGYLQSWKLMSNGQYKLILIRQLSEYTQSIIIYYDLVKD